MSNITQCTINNDPMGLSIAVINSVQKSQSEDTELLGTFRADYPEYDETSDEIIYFSGGIVLIMKLEGANNE